MKQNYCIPYEILEKFINEETLHRKDYRILAFLLLNSKEHIIYIKQKKISKMLGFEKTSVSKSIKRLIDCGFIEKIKNENEYSEILTGYRLLF